MLAIPYIILFVLLFMVLRGESDDFTSMNELFVSFNPTGPIAKKITSGRTRLVFVAGLEGTGHHAWSDMFSECLKNQTCEVAKELTQTLMHFDHVNHVVHGLFGATDAQINAPQITKVIKLMQQMAARPGDHLYLMGLCFVHLSAMMSYPNYNGKHKALDHPDISTLAAVAEFAGLDFRVILLQRSAEETLNSTANRNIGGREEPKIQLDNAAALFSQLRLIDRTFYHCVQFRALGHLTTTQQDTITNFLHPQLLPPIFGKMLTRVQYSGTNSTRPPLRALPSREPTPELSSAEREVANQSRRYHVWQLAQRLQLIDQLCHT